MKPAALLLILSISFLLGFCSTVNAEPNLISWWKFDKGIGTIAYDSAGDNNGTITGATWTTEGKIGGALSFDGDHDYVTVGDKADLEQQAFTLSFWAKLNNPSGTLQGGIAKGHIFGSPTEYSYKLDFDSGTAYSSITNTSNAAFGANGSIGDSGWHLWSMTAGGGTLTLYKDGAFVNNIGYTGTIDYDKTNDNFVIGARSGGSYAFNGKIDDVRFYDRALSEEEIEQLYREGLVYTAWAPNPADGVIGADPNVVLSWSPGNATASHDVYFGTDYNDVNDANIFSPEYIGNFDVNYWDPCGLEEDTFYYWRIDEVNEPNLWKGRIWSFDTRCVVPNIANMTEANAFAALNAAGFTVGVKTTAYSDTAEYLKMAGSNPPAGATPGCGTVVDYIVSEGSECYVGMPDYYTQWTPAGRPRCWCYPRQCHGDADGKLGPYKTPIWVSSADLTILKNAWMKSFDQLTGTAICADFDRKASTTKAPIYRVTTADLAILKANWMIYFGPDPNCLPGNRTP